MEIGFCGIGRMGAAMVARLIDQGHRPTIWNRSREKAAVLIERGAHWADSPAAVAAANEITFTILTDAKAIEAVYDGPDGLLSGDPGGKLFVEMSTVSPNTVRALAGRVAATGAALLDCPVGGTVGPAREGKLIGMAGGAAADFARAQPILAQLCRRLDHLGPVGNGAAMKLAINLPTAIYWEAFGEALSFCRDAEIDPGRMFEIFMDSSGGTNTLRARGPHLVAEILHGTVPTAGFDIDGVRKDLRTMIGVAQEMGFEVPLTTKALDCYDAASQDGWGHRDLSEIALYRLDRSKAGGR